MVNVTSLPAALYSDKNIQACIELQSLPSLSKKNYKPVQDKYALSTATILELCREVKKSKLRQRFPDDVEKIFDAFTVATGIDFRFVKSNADIIVERLKDGYTANEIINVIKNKKRCWPEHIQKNIRPQTICKKDLLSKYVTYPPKPKADPLITYQNEVNRILTLLNEMTGNAYQNESEDGLIIANLLTIGTTVEQLEKVVKYKHQVWQNTDSFLYLRPATLFGPKFQKYLTEATAEPVNNALALKVDTSHIERLFELFKALTGAVYRCPSKDADLIIKLLNQGYSIQQLASVVKMKYNEWKDGELIKYVRPYTLFNANKFPDYLNEFQLDLKGHGKKLSNYEFGEKYKQEYVFGNRNNG